MVLEIPGIQSTHAITADCETGIIYNHVWPWVDYKKGIVVTAKPKRIKRKAKNAGRYAEVKRQKVDLTRFKRKMNVRNQMLEKIETWIDFELVISDFPTYFLTENVQ